MGYHNLKLIIEYDGDPPHRRSNRLGIRAQVSYSWRCNDINVANMPVHNAVAHPQGLCFCKSRKWIDLFASATHFPYSWLCTTRSCLMISDQVWVLEFQVLCLDHWVSVHESVDRRIGGGSRSGSMSFTVLRLEKWWLMENKYEFGVGHLLSSVWFGPKSFSEVAQLKFNDVVNG